QVLCSQATVDLVRDSLPSPVGLVELGLHQLQDLSRPEVVSQLTHPELGSEFPALRSLEPFPGNLPRQVTSFIGRRADLASVASELEDAPLVTLTGVGGVGKTRLSLEVAASLLPITGTVRGCASSTEYARLTPCLTPSPASSAWIRAPESPSAIC